MISLAIEVLPPDAARASRIRMLHSGAWIWHMAAMLLARPGQCENTGLGELLWVAST